VLAVGATVPTGSIDKTARMLTPMNTTMEMVMPYGMQMGSGTVDPFVSLTWAAEAGRVSWGAQGRATLRLYDNDRDYRLGDEAAVTAWAGYSPAPSLSLTVRAEARAWGDISGRDVRIAGASPSANPANYGGEQV